MIKPLCIYHGNCADGFAAAWAVWDIWGNEMDYYAGTHQANPPDVTDRFVLMVDFSYKRPVIKRMAEQAHGILILDHHKSAAEDLCGFSEPPADLLSDLDRHGRLARQTVYVLFDMERSGARIAWDFFHPNEEPPQLLLHVEDRDLWRFDLPYTREIQAAVFSYQYDFKTWEKLMLSTPLETLIDAGQAIERKHHKDVEELVRVCQRKAKIGGYEVPIASIPYTMASDAGHLMAERQLFAACWWMKPGGVVFSLRSNKGGFDVSEIAERYGGGGHLHAAGFQISLDEFKEQFL